MHGPKRLSARRGAEALPIVVSRLVGMSDSSTTPGPRPLSYWLDAEYPEPSAVMSEQTVLRSMALRWVSRRITVISFWTLTAAFTVLTALTRSFDVSVSPGLVGVLAACTAVIAVVFTVYHRARPVPSSKVFDRDVWIATTRGGVLAAAATTSVILLLWMLPLLSSGAGFGLWLTSIYSLNAFVFSTQFIVQGWHYQHSRRLFRHHLRTNDQARTVVEDMALNPPVAVRTCERFGPL